VFSWGFMKLLDVEGGGHHINGTRGHKGRIRAARFSMP
jgi:hypothetical protein